MKYLIRQNGKKTKAHIWIGSDTACKMMSTGGLLAENYKLHETNGQKKICAMCKHNYYKKGIIA